MCRFLFASLFLLLEFQPSRGWTGLVTSGHKLPQLDMMASRTLSMATQPSLEAVETWLLSSQDIPPALQDLLRLIPPSSYYKSNQLQDAYTTMLGLLSEEDKWQGTTFVHDATTYYLQTLHVACHEILGHVHISLAKDVYDQLSYKRPEWCRWMFEIFNTCLDVHDDDLIRVIKDWVACSENPNEVKEYLITSKRQDLWDQLLNDVVRLGREVTLNNVGLPTKSAIGAVDPRTTNDSADNGVEASTISPPTMREVETVPDLSPRELFHHLVEKIDIVMSQPSINATEFYPTVYLAIEALKRINGVMENDLRTGLYIASSCLLRRDASWIFRLLDQRGMVQRDDLYQLLHVYCSDHRQPFGIHFALSILKYCEKQSERNAYIRRPDPLMYRIVLKAMGDNAAYGFGHCALSIMKSMSIRKKGADIDSECWKPIFEDHASAVAAFVDNSVSWPSVQRADGLVRSLYTGPVGMREAKSTSTRLDQLVRVGRKLRIVPVMPRDAPGPLLKVLNAYKEQDCGNSQDRVVAAISLFEYAVEQTAAGSGSLEELSKMHFFVIVELCRQTNTFLVQESVRLFRRVDQLVGQGLLSRDLVSPSVSYQILSLLAAERSPGLSTSAEYILDHYVSQTKDPRLAAFQFAIQCCCSESGALGCSKAVALLDRAVSTFQRKPFRDSVFLETLKQLELHDTDGKHAAKMYNILSKKLHPTSLDIDSRIAILMSSYRCLLNDPSSQDKVQEVVARLAHLQEANPNHPAFAGECFQNMKSSEFVATVASGQTVSAIDILLSSKETDDIVMADSILEQGEAEGRPHGPQTYRHVIEAFIGNNDMSAATNVLSRMKTNHPNACRELESNMFDILLSSGQASDLELAESMLRWANDMTDLRNKATKMVITCMSLSLTQGKEVEVAERILNYLGDLVGEEDDVWTDLSQLICQDD